MAWSGTVLVVSLFAAYLHMGFLPPPRPDLAPEAIKEIFIGRQAEIRLAAAVLSVSFVFYLTWAMSIVMMMRPMERGLPILTWTSIANAGGGFVFFLLQPITWATLAYRPEILPPWFLQFMYDWVWFIFILSWPPFAIFMLMIGIAILRDHNMPRIMPKWVAYLNLWCALTISPAVLILFFKTGPFTYSGLIDFWFIFIVFFGWMVMMTIATLKAADALAVREASHEAVQ
jgi:hypothetical protein